jgi:hypothetical protein
MVILLLTDKESSTYGRLHLRSGTKPGHNLIKAIYSMNTRVMENDNPGKKCRGL